MFLGSGLKTLFVWNICEASCPYSKVSNSIFLIEPQGRCGPPPCDTLALMDRKPGPRSAPADRITWITAITNLSGPLWVTAVCYRQKGRCSLRSSLCFSLASGPLNAPHFTTKWCTFTRLFAYKEERDNKTCNANCCAKIITGSKVPFLTLLIY